VVARTGDQLALQFAARMRMNGVVASAVRHGSTGGTGRKSRITCQGWKSSAKGAAKPGLFER
jgi:hypothetical protein